MALVRIPAPSGQLAAAGPARLSIRLVDADDRPVLGWVGAALMGEYEDLPLVTERLVELIPQSQIALPGGGPTWYAVVIANRARTQRYSVQVPDAAGVLELRDLVAASEGAARSLSAALVAELRAESAAFAIALGGV
jgi:hypothetical protein